MSYPPEKCRDLFGGCRVHVASCTCYESREYPRATAREMRGPRPFRYWFRWWAAGCLTLDATFALLASPWIWIHFAGLLVFLALLDWGFKP